MYEANYAQQLETSPRPYHTLAVAYASITGGAIDTRMVQKMLKSHSAQAILGAMQTMGDRVVDKPVPYLMGILKKRDKTEFNQQIKEDKFDAIIDEAREPRAELEVRSPFNGTSS